MRTSILLSAAVTCAALSLLAAGAGPAGAAGAEDPGPWTQADGGERSGRPHARAAVAPDAHTAVRDIVFPVIGDVRYTDTFGACRSGCSRSHQGQDLMGEKLMPLLAANDATVTWLRDNATPSGSRGNLVILTDAEGWEYWYIHVNNDSPGTDDGANPRRWAFTEGIDIGAEVRAGEHIAYMGDSGNAEWTAPHLHFEIRKPDGSVINAFRSLQQALVLEHPVSDGDPAVSPSREAPVGPRAWEEFEGRRIPRDGSLVAERYKRASAPSTDLLNPERAVVSTVRSTPARTSPVPLTHDGHAAAVAEQPASQAVSQPVDQSVASPHQPAADLRPQLLRASSATALAPSSWQLLLARLFDAS